MRSNRSAYDSAVKGFLYLLPGMTVYFLFILLPVLRTIGLSFYSWDGLSPRNFIGMENYFQMLEDERFIGAISHNLILVVFLMVLPTLLGLLLATVIETGKVRLRKLFEVTFFIPQILSLVVVAVIWRWIYNPAFGILNELLELLHLKAFTRPWLGSSRTALFSVGMAGTWVNYGFAMVVFLAGYTRIPASYYESADIDGAGSRQKFFYISLPALAKEIRVVAVFLFISSLKTFDLVYVMTKGGPGYSTNVLSLYVFKNAFQYNLLGYAATLAFTLAVLIFFTSYLITLMRSRRENA
ncbi:MAG: sugar ABC transporter permease [Spirochaetaceae bacterium]|nr:sugar ABC transporter permease [Spirochaetaceae bacterium]MCF7939625.1 sugar ABC transporter permease [Spirochaetales bacterium]